MVQRESEREWREIHLGSRVLDLFQTTCGLWVTGIYKPTKVLRYFNFLLCKTQIILVVGMPHWGALRLHSGKREAHPTATAGTPPAPTAEELTLMPTHSFRHSAHVNRTAALSKIRELRFRQIWN